MKKSALFLTLAALTGATAWSADAVAPKAAAGSQPQPKGAAFQVTHFSIDAGGGSATGGSFEVFGIIGQADVEPAQPSVGGRFAVTGGFLVPATGPTEPEEDLIFSDGFEG